MISAKFIPLIYFAVASVAAMANPTGPIDPANYAAPVRVACVGDSITAGLYVPSGKSYPDQLQAILGDNWQVRNFGVSARTLLKKGDLPYWNETAFHDAQDFKPDVVIIMLGTNDTKPVNWSHHGDFYADYKELVEIFKNLPSKPHIFLCRPVPVIGPGNYGINERNLEIEIPLIDQLAAAENVDLIDMHAALAGKPAFFSDRVHPTEAGDGIMAQSAAAALTGKSAP